jgi:hypothetical protein
MALVLIPTVDEALETGVASLVQDLAISHVISRVVPRQLLFSAEAKAGLFVHGCLSAQ